MEPKLTTSPERQPVLDELIAREPIFHRPEFGTDRADFEAMVEADFREVGASGRRDSRKHVRDMLVERHSRPREDRWETRDFHCRELGPDTYLVTYTLDQAGRITRRATIWRRRRQDWKIVYHQGTIVEGP